MRHGPMRALAPAALVLLLLAAAPPPVVRGQEAAAPPATEPPAAAASPDAQGLLALKASIAGSSNALASWSAGSDPCSATAPWAGVNCTTNRVTSVTLAGLGLTGKLPASLALPELQTLALGSNQLDGTLPPQLTSPTLQRLLLGNNQLTGELPTAWATGLPALRELELQGNRLEGTVPPTWLAATGFASPFVAVLQPGNPLLCGAFSPAAGHSVVFADGTVRHIVSTTLGSCATLDGNCGSASVNASAPNLYDVSWSNRVAALDLEAFNPSVQQGAAPSPGSPVQLPCYPSNAPTFFGGDAALGKATWQSSTNGALGSWLPVSGNRQPVSAEECSMTADAPAYWVVDLQRTTQVLAVLVRAGPQQMTGVDIRVGDDPSPTAGAVCKAGDSFDPGVGKVIPCARVLKGRYVSISAATRVSLCVVEVYPLVSNAALGKRTTASGPSADAAQSQVVNGRIDNQQCAQVMSGTNLAAWITIDLGYEAAVETVVVVNGLSKFTNDLYIRLGNNAVVNGDENEVCSQPQTLPERGTLPIQCTRGNTAATGRFLTLYRQSNQPSSMYLCQVLAFLAEGPREFIIPPPPPPSPPASPPPSPSPSTATINVQESTQVMEVALTVSGGSLVPLNSAVQNNVLLAANNTWLGNDGMTGVSLDSSQESSGSVALRFRVNVAQPQAPAAASFVQTTVSGGTLDLAFRDEGLGDTTSTLQSVLAVDSVPPSNVSPAPSPPPSPTNDSSSSVPIGAIVGGIVGGAVVLALVALLLVRRRRRRAGYARRQALGDGNESPKVGAMEAGRGTDLLGFPKPGDVPNGYKVAVAAAGGSSSTALQLDADSLTRGPPADIISFLADDNGMPVEGPHRDSPGGSTSGREGRPSGELSKQRSLAPSSRLGSGVSELWTVDFRELDIQKEVGQGSFGRVYLAKWRETTVAVKVLGALGADGSSLDDEFPDAAVGKTHPLYESLQQEAAMMASLRHPSIVMYLGVCLDPPAVVTEYCARGSLNDVLKRARSSPLLAAQLDWPRRLNMALDAAKGMLYLHSCAPPIIHRDLKSANLLVDKHWRVRVCDFNLSRAMEDNAVLSSMAATNPRWLAPEILSGKGYTFASDVYSFGICMWELLTWQVPYWEYGPWQVVAMVTENAQRPEVPPREELPTGPFRGEGEYLALMRECWAQDPAQRPTFAAIISRLRRMLAAEASLRRDSPTKAPRGRGSDTGLGLSGDDTPLARSRLASLSVPSVSDSLCVSPLDPRSVGDEAASLVSLEGVAGSPAPLPSAAQPRRSSAGGAGQLASIAGGDTDEAEAAEAAEVAAAAGAAGTAGSTQPPSAPGTAAAAAAAAAAGEGQQQQHAGEGPAILSRNGGPPPS